MRKFGLVLLAILAVVPAFAQQPDPMAIVAHILELSPDQITAWSQILHARQAAIEPLAHEAQAREQAIGQQFASGNPDPAVVGRALVELHALQEQVGQVNAQSLGQFAQILTPEQQQRLNEIRYGAQVCPIVPAFQATGLL